MTLETARTRVFRRLNDTARSFWTLDEVDRNLSQAYREITHRTRVLWDIAYVENLPRGFSYTGAWEEDYADFHYGVANYTIDDERRLVDPEYAADGPANHTSPFEIPYLSEISASVSSHPTVTVPELLSEHDRPTYDDMAVPVITARDAAQRDSRFEVTQGPVFAIVTKGDGLRTIRKVRVPSLVANTYTITGSWGILRRPTDISEDTVSGTWGVPRQIPSMFAMGAYRFGVPRRPYRDGLNVRLEHWREGEPVTLPADVFELPERAAAYVVDGAISACYAKSGPAQDLRLAKHYAERFERGVIRLTRRVEAMGRTRVPVMGGARQSRPAGPPTPSLPWAYGAQVRGSR